MLALWVMIFHLLSVPVIGSYAVFSFFVLSGFLMTTIMKDTYDYTSDGIKRYTINRCLRLYPMYWVIAIFTLLAISITSPDYSADYKTALSFPESSMDIIFNTIMIFPSLFPYDIEPRLSPPTWALTLEIFFYVCIALGISRTRKITIIWVSISIIYYIFSYVIDLSNAHRYASVYGASLPFSLGALLYYYKEQIFNKLKHSFAISPVISLGLYIFNAFLFTMNDHYEIFQISEILKEVGKYTNLCLSLLVITSLHYNGSKIISKHMDKKIGDYSYPLYLIHWQCGLIASYLLFDTPVNGGSMDGLLVFGLAILISIFVSYLLIIGIDKNISNIRNRLRPVKN